MVKYNVDKYINEKINKLTILREIKSKKKGTFVLCKCDCGNTKVILLYNILKNKTKSCGMCKYKGHYDTRLAGIYSNMVRRCTSKKSSDFKNYGARGISVCSEWLNDFTTFYHWAINNGYSDTLTLDRIDTNGNYEPSNCRWVNMKTQQNNRRNNVMITYMNETKSLTEWSNILGINYSTLRNRLYRDKWSIEKSFQTKVVSDK